MFEKFKTKVNSLKGDIAEVGVYQGRTAKKLAETFPDRAIHLFDTFSGMPPVDPDIDSHKEGDFSSTSLTAVQEYLGKYKNIIYHPGFFPNTAYILQYRRFAFVNVDVDLYRSTKDCLEFFWPRMVEKGILFIQDDYNARMCTGVKRAVDEFVYAEGYMLKRNGIEAWIIK